MIDRRKNNEIRYFGDRAPITGNKLKKTTEIAL